MGPFLFRATTMPHFTIHHTSKGPAIVACLLHVWPHRWCELIWREIRDTWSDLLELAYSGISRYFRLYAMT